MAPARTERYLGLNLATVMLVSGLLIGSLLFLGCGDPNRSLTSHSNFAPRYVPPKNAERGGELRVLASGDVDSLDPGVLQGQFAGMVASATNRTLVSAFQSRRSGLRPDVAVELPRVDRLGGTVLFRLRNDVRFSPPVSRRVRAEDFEYALERGLLPGVANGYLNVFLPGLEGLAPAAKAAMRVPTTAPDITGIEALGARRLRLKFDGQVPPLAVAALSMPFAAPVPREYAAGFDREIPSTYGVHAVASGPYMIANDSEGNLSGYEPGSSIRLVRNPEWNPSSDFRPAFLDSIRVESGYSNTNMASQDILTGRSAINGDFAPSSAMLRIAAGSDPGQLMMIPSGAVLYAALNTTIPPLDDINVRRAIVAATDRTALRAARGGKVTGKLATHFIPPGVPGFEYAGGFKGPGFDFLSHPSGDSKLAAKYLRRAGYPAGTYSGDARLTMITDTTEVGQRTGEVVRQAIESLGIPVTVRKVVSDVMYSRFCNVPAAAVAICPNVGWIQQLNDPQTIFSQTFNGEAIQRINNSNWPQLNVPRVNAAMRRAEQVHSLSDRAKSWGRIDRMVTSLAPAIPNLWSEVAVIASSDVETVIDPALAAPSLTMTSLKDPSPKDPTPASND